MANWQTTITGLDSETSYDIEVLASNASGDSEAALITSATAEYSAPGQPSIVPDSVTQTGYSLTFDPVPLGETPVGYKAYLSSDDSLLGESSGGREDTTVVVSGRTAGANETVYIVAYDAGGEGVASVASAAIYLAPEAIIATLVGQSDDAMSLVYSGGAGAVTFEVYSDGNLLTSSVDGNAITISGLTAGQDYINIVVKAYNADSSAFTESNVIALAPTLTVLHAPGVTTTYNDTFTFENWSSVSPLAAPTQISTVDLCDSVGGTPSAILNLTDVGNAFDNNTTTFATATDSGNANVTFGWSFGGVPEAQSVKRIKVRTGIDGVSSTVKDYVVKGDNGSTPVTIKSGQLANIPNYWHSIDLSTNDDSYYNYTIEFTSKWATKSDVGEIEFLGNIEEAQYSLPAGSTPSFKYTFPTVQDLEKVHFVMFSIKSSHAGQFLLASLDGLGSTPITIDEANVWETKYIPVYDIARASRKAISEIQFTATDTSVTRAISMKEVSQEAPNYGVSLSTVQVDSDIMLYWSLSSTPLDKTVFCYNNTGFDDVYTEVELDNTATNYTLPISSSMNYFVGVATKDYDGSLTQVTEIAAPVWLGVPVAPTVAPVISNITATDFTATLTAVNGADSYEIYLDGVLTSITNSSNLVVDNILFTGDPKAPCSVTYRAVNTSGATSFSPEAIAIPAAAPTWASPVPSDGLGTFDTAPHLFPYTVSWSEVIGATSYDIEISIDGVVDGSGNFVTPVYNFEGITGLSYEIPDALGLVYGKKHYWHVRPVNTYGVGFWSTPANSFVVDVPAPVAVSPLEGATNISTVLDMDWTPAIAAKWVDVIFEWEVGEAAVVIDSAEGITLFQASYPGTVSLSLDTEYWWQVRGYTALAPRTTTDEWSTPQNFTTLVSAPTAFDVLLPAENSVVDCDPLEITFTWEASNVDYYRLYIDALPVGSPMVYQVDVGESHSLALLCGTEYQWYVEAVNGAGGTMSTSTRSLVVKTEAPLLDAANTVNDVASQTGEQAIVKWSVSDDTGIVGYRVKWGTVSGTYTDTSSDIAGAGVTEFTVTGLTNGENYYFVVVSYDTSDNESLASNESNAVLITDLVVPQITEFNAAPNPLGEAIDLTWIVPAEFDRLKIVRKEGSFVAMGSDPEGSPDVSATTVYSTNDGGMTSYTDDGS